MGRHKKVVMDQLSIDSSNAIKAGMTYGKYMATKKPVTIKTPENLGYKHTCNCCGKEFYTNKLKLRKFCDDQCREQYYRDLERVPPTIKVCPICGVEFEAPSRYKYCTDFCAKIAKSNQSKDWQARKKEAAE